MMNTKLQSHLNSYNPHEDLALQCQFYILFYSQVDVSFGQFTGRAGG